MSYVIRRLLISLLVIFGVVSLTFFMLHLVPGDPVEAMLGESASIADRDVVREKLGLDQPLSTQYLIFWQNVVQLDFGQSIHFGQPVLQLIGERLGWTALLALTSLLCAVLIAFPLGILAAIYKGSWIDKFAMTFATLGISIPNFWMGLLLILIFAFWLSMFPVSGNESWLAFVLPTLTLGTALSAILSRMLRSTLLETLHEDYVRTARAKGLSYITTVTRHALQNAALPMITLLGLQLGALLAGAVITEVVFSWPGIGQLTVEAIQRRDYPVVQVCVMLIASIYVLVNLATDVLYGSLDPRIRLS